MFPVESLVISGQILSTSVTQEAQDLCTGYDGIKKSTNRLFRIIKDLVLNGCDPPMDDSLQNGGKVYTRGPHGNIN